MLARTGIGMSCASKALQTRRDPQAEALTSVEGALNATKQLQPWGFTIWPLFHFEKGWSLYGYGVRSTE